MKIFTSPRVAQEDEGKSDPCPLPFDSTNQQEWTVATLPRLYVFFYFFFFFFFFFFLESCILWPIFGKSKDEKLRRSTAEIDRFVKASERNEKERAYLRIIPRQQVRFGLGNVDREWSRGLVRFFKLFGFLLKFPCFDQWRQQGRQVEIFGNLFPSNIYLLTNALRWIRHDPMDTMNAMNAMNAMKRAARLAAAGLQPTLCRSNRIFSRRSTRSSGSSIERFPSQGYIRASQSIKKCLGEPSIFCHVSKKILPTLCHVTVTWTTK